MSNLERSTIILVLAAASWVVVIAALTALALLMGAQP